MHVLPPICDSCEEPIAYQPLRMMANGEWIILRYLWLHIYAGERDHSAKPASILKRIRAILRSTP